MKIADGIFQVGGSDLSADGDASVYLVDGPERTVMIDAGTGMGEEEILGNVQRCGVDPGRITHLVLTHCHVDHSGGVPGMRRRLGLKVVAHRVGAEILSRGDDPRTAASWYGMRLPPMTIDLVFDDEYRLPLGDTDLILIHTPGHSPDSIIAFLDRGGRRTVFAQDVHGPIHPALASDAKLYQQGLKKLLDLKADVLCEGHFGVYEPADVVERYIRRFMD